MENHRRRHNRQMPDKRKVLMGSASIVTNSVTGKRNAARKHLVLRTERSELKAVNKPQKTALSITEKWYARFFVKQATPANTATRDREMLASTDSYHTTNKHGMKHAMRDAR